MGNKKGPILLIGNFGRFGGTRTYFQILLDSCIKLNYDVFVVIYGEVLDQNIVTYLTKKGVSYSFIKKGSFSPKRFSKINKVINLLIIYVRIFYLIIRKKPCFMIISNWAIDNFLSLLLLPIKSINIVHTYPTRELSNFGVWVMQRLINNSRFIVTVSEYSKDNIVKYWLGDSRGECVKVVYNTTGYDDIREIQKNSDRVVRIITLGHVRWYKSPLLWIRVAKKVIKQNVSGKVEFIWVGDGELIGECRRLVSDSNGVIKFVGYKNNVSEIYSNTDIYFQPSKLESFGLSVAEAMYWGLPCVVSKNGGLPELVIDGYNGFVVELEKEAFLLEKIQELIDSPSLRKKFGLASIKTHKQKFSKKVFEKRMSQLFEDILHENKI